MTTSATAWLFTQQATTLRCVVGLALIALGLRKLLALRRVAP